MALDSAADMAKVEKKMKDKLFPNINVEVPKTSILVSQMILRGLAIIFTLIAIIVTLTSTQIWIFFKLRFRISYTYSSAFKFLVGTDAVVCVFSTISLVFYYLLSSKASQIRNYFFVFLHDMVILVVITSGCGAGSAVGYVGKYGEEQMNWQPVCNYVPKFCNKMIVSMLFSYFALFTYLSLVVLSAHTLIIHHHTPTPTPTPTPTQP